MLRFRFDKNVLPRDRTIHYVRHNDVLVDYIIVVFLWASLSVFRKFYNNKEKLH